MRSHLINLCLLISTLLSGCTSASKENLSNDQSPQQSANDLPIMNITKTDGSRIDVNTLKGNTVLILFQADCDHCQREAKEIREHMSYFKNYSVYFISADPVTALEKFGNDYNLLSQPNVHFGSTTVESVLNSFGPIPTPSVYIYLDQRLVKKFNGEVQIEKILQVI